MNTWYYSDAHRNRLGPVAADDLAQLHNSGQLAPDVLVWREGLPDWRPWSEVMDEVLGRGLTTPPRAVFPAAAGDDAPVAGSGNPYEVVERVPASPYAAPSTSVGMRAGPIPDGAVVYAGFWKRVAAYFIDVFIIILVSALVGGIAGAVIGMSGGDTDGGAMAVIQLLSSLAGIAYFAAFHASGAQATPGKMAVGIKVARGNGEPISFLRGVGRYFATLLSSLILLIGYAMAGFTERKQALHDMVCDTLVVDKWAFTAYPDRQRSELGPVTIIVLVLGIGGGIVAMVALVGFIAALGSASS